MLWGTMNVLGLLPIECSNQGCSIPNTTHPGLLDTVAGATLFSTMDITAAYHQIPVAKEDIPKMDFITKYGLYEFKTMPFGLRTAPQTYQRLIELVLSGL